MFQALRVYQVTGGLQVISTGHGADGQWVAGPGSVGSGSLIQVRGSAYSMDLRGPVEKDLAHQEPSCSSLNRDSPLAASSVPGSSLQGPRTSKGCVETSVVCSVRWSFITDGSGWVL